MFPSSIPKEEIQHLPLIRFGGKITLIETEKDLNQALKELRKERIWGFDTETKPTFNKGEYNHTGLIQFATMKAAYLIRINKLGIPPKLRTFLEDDQFVKVGISIRDDLKEMKKLEPFHPDGFIDLNNIAKELGIVQIGMRSLTGIFLKSRISKSQQTSNWENAELTPAQQLYAATDAWVCYKIHRMLNEQGYL